MREGESIFGHHKARDHEESPVPLGSGAARAGSCRRSGWRRVRRRRNPRRRTEQQGGSTTRRPLRASAEIELCASWLELASCRRTREVRDTLRVGSTLHALICCKQAPAGPIGGQSDNGGKVGFHVRIERPQVSLLVRCVGNHRCQNKHPMTAHNNAAFQKLV
jgi:hypothetical protein